MAEEAAARRLLRSHEKAPAAGLYLAVSHLHHDFRLELLVSSGDELPNCPHCDEEVDWKYLGRPGRKVLDRDKLLTRTEVVREPAGSKA